MKSKAPQSAPRPLRLAVRSTLALFIGLAAWHSADGYRHQRAQEQRIATAYDFVVDNGDISEQLPCYCGCGEWGHASLDMCFVARRDRAGRMVARDEHAESCPICIDVALLAARLKTAGLTDAAIAEAVEAQYGPPAR